MYSMLFILHFPIASFQSLSQHVSLTIATLLSPQSLQQPYILLQLLRLHLHLKLQLPDLLPLLLYDPLLLGLFLLTSVIRLSIRQRS